MGDIRVGGLFFCHPEEEKKVEQEQDRDGEHTTTLLLTTDRHLESWWEQPAGHAR